MSRKPKSTWWISTDADWVRIALYESEAIVENSTLKPWNMEKEFVLI